MFVAGMTDSPLLRAQGVYAVEGYVRSVEEILSIIREGYREVFVDMRSALSGRGLGGRPVDSWALDETLRNDGVRRELERLPDSPADSPAIDAADQDGEGLQAAVERARALYAENLAAARQLFTEAAQGKSLSLDMARETVSASIKGLSENPTAVRWAALLEQGGARLHIHSVNVSLLAAAFGLRLGLDREDVFELGLSGLLHDLGQTRLPLELTARNGALTPREHALFARHPRETESLLRRQGKVSNTVLRAVLEHHERHDGTGYPARLPGAERSLLGRVLALADQFDLLARPGGDSESESPAKAATLLYAGRGKIHSADDLERFIRFVGIYPLGTLVRLTDGRVGMVWRSDPENPLAPLVNVAFDAQLRPVRPERVNLAAQEGGVRVQAIVNPLQLNVSPGKLTPADA